MKIRFISREPFDCTIAGASVRVDFTWADHGGHFGHIVLFFKLHSGKSAYFVISPPYTDRAKMREAWFTGFDAPVRGPAARAIKALISQGLAAEADDEERTGSH